MPSTTIKQLARSSFLDALPGSDLVVYLRVIGASGEQHSKRIRITNYDLHTNPRTAAAALRRLQDNGLINIHYDGHQLGRSIEVLR